MTASRSASISAGPSLEATRASSPCVTLRPEAAITRSSSWVPPGSASTRTIRASRSVSGSPLPLPSPVAASSSSAKNGLPPERSNRASATRGVGVRPEDARQLSDQLQPGERAQLDPLDPVQPLGLGEEGPQRVAPVELVGPVGRDQHEPLAARGAQQEGEEVARRAVGPVQVLDDEHERRLLGQPAEQGEQRLEQAGLGELLVGGGGGRVAGLGQQPAQLGLAGAGQLAEGVGAELAPQVAQRRDDRGVGQLALAQLDAVAGQHARAGGPGALGALVHQAALADARVAGHQQRARLARGGALHGLVESGQLLGAADEGRTGYPPHRAIIHGADRQLRRMHGAAGAATAAPGGDARAALTAGRAGCARLPRAARPGASPRRCMSGLRSWSRSYG